MNKKSHPDWDPRSDAVRKDQIAASDDMRRRRPVTCRECLAGRCVAMTA